MDLNWCGRVVGQGMEFQLRGNLLCDGDSSLGETAKGLEGSTILHLTHHHYVCNIVVCLLQLHTMSRVTVHKKVYVGVQDVG